LAKKSDIALTTEQLIQTYMLGIFPMSDSRNSEKTYFVNPEQRCVMPIKEFHVSKSLLRPDLVLTNIGHDHYHVQ